MRLGEPLLRFRRIDSHSVIFGADTAHEAGDEAAARQVVEHGVFFRDHERIVEERQRAAENGDLGALDRTRQRAGQQARNRHHAVRRLVVFVEADAVEAKLVGQFHLVKVLVIKLRALFGIVIAVGKRHPCRAVAADRVEIDMAIRHQVKVEDFHLRSAFSWPGFLCRSLDVGLWANNGRQIGRSGPARQYGSGVCRQRMRRALDALPPLAHDVAIKNCDGSRCNIGA